MAWRPQPAMKTTVSGAAGVICGCGERIEAGVLLTFLHNHREAIAALDFFTVPTITFRLLYCFFVIEHGRRHPFRTLRPHRINSARNAIDTEAAWSRRARPSRAFRRPCILVLLCHN